MNALAEKIYHSMRKIGIFDLIPDKPYLKLIYRLKMGKPLDLKNPKTFNEKLQWMKLFDRRPEYTTMVDKYAVRDYVAQKIGREYLIPLLGVWDNTEDIDFSALPDKFVMKCNHNSGFGMIICTDKSSLNIADAKKQIKEGLLENYYLLWREWPYKNVKRKIICESFMENQKNHELLDYKIHCFHGKPEFILVCSGRFSESGLHESFYSTKWEKLDLKRPAIPCSDNIDKPAQLDEMLVLAEKLSAGCPFIRTDFYVVNGKVYFGEITLFPASGLAHFEPASRDKQFGDLLFLNQFEAHSQTLART